MTGSHSPRVRLAVILACLALMLFSAGVSEARPSPDAASRPSADNGTSPESSSQELSITYLRQLTYPGSDICIEQKLAPGPNYNRYIASYRSQGLKEYALLTVPTAKPPKSGWPAIVFNHGYIPPGQYVTTERYVAYVDALARAGYVVFKPDYRGHGRSEGHAPGPYQSPAYTIDVLNAVSSLKHLDAVDPERIGMWGHSMGGWITLRAMVTSKDIKAGVIWGGVVAGYEELVAAGRPGDKLSADTLYASRTNGVSMYTAHPLPPANPQLWEDLSANYFLDDLAGPIQLHHALGDGVVPAEFSELLYDQAVAAGMPVSLYEYRGDDHNISRNFDQAMKSTIAYFNRWLQAPVNLSAKDGPRVYAGASEVNVRAAATTASAIVAKMQPGDSLPIIGATPDRSWWQVQLKNKTGWVAASVTIAAHTSKVPIVR